MYPQGSPVINSYNRDNTRSYTTHQERYENETNAYAQANRAEGWDIPRYTGVMACPTQPEDPDDDQRTSQHRTH